MPARALRLIYLFALMLGFEHEDREQILKTVLARITSGLCGLDLSAEHAPESAANHYGRPCAFIASSTL